jgi:hypothetical protein
LAAPRSRSSLHAPDLDRSDPGLDRALGPVAVPHHAVAAVGELAVGKVSEKGFRFGLDGLRKKTPRPRSQDSRQRIIDLIRLTKRNNGAIA